MFSKEKYEHSYPFCWRCDTPLLYYAMDSWFIQTTAIKDQLIANNNEVDWYPGHVREGRFGKFLEDLVDWNISRDRYWGTPLNIWVCEETGRTIRTTQHCRIACSCGWRCAENLELHKPYVDEVKVMQLLWQI